MATERTLSLTTPLTIPVDEIPEAGFVVKRDFPAEWVGDSALPAYRALSPVSIDVVAKRYQDNVHVEGRVCLDLGFTCGRSLVDSTARLDISFSELFQPAGASSINLGEGIDGDDIEDQPYTYEEGSIDLEPLIREEIVLAQDPYPTVTDSTTAGTEPVWTSAETNVDSRWAQLAQLKIQE